MGKVPCLTVMRGTRIVSRRSVALARGGVVCGSADVPVKLRRPDGAEVVRARHLSRDYVVSICAGVNRWLTDPSTLEAQWGDRLRPDTPTSRSFEATC